MRNSFLILFLVVIGMFLSTSFIYAADWEISQFTSEITVLEDGSLLITETIETNFFVPKHGIYRDIPVKYKDKYGNNLSLKLKIKNITDKKGNPWEYKAGRQGPDLHIRIGSPDITISGFRTYIITYQVKRAVNYFEEHDELYWNVTGDRWEVPIQKVQSAVKLPIYSREVESQCFTGPLGSTAEDCLISETEGELIFSANDFLTIVVGWPKGVIYKPAWHKEILWFLGDNFGYLIPLIIFVFILYQWWTKGRDPEGRSSIIVQYDPPGDLTPSEMAGLVYERVRAGDLTADLINLASRGYIKIRETREKRFLKDKVDYELIKRKEWQGDFELKKHEEDLLKTILGDKDKIKLSDLKNKFYNKVPGLKKQIINNLLSLKYFYEDPGRIKIKYLLIGIAISLLSFLTVLLGLHIFIGILVSGALIIIFSFFMPKRSKAGALAYQHALGFKKYIEIAEEHRIKWEEKENLFFQFLPYAMVFNLADKWAKAFEGIYNQPPEWYEGSFEEGFSPAVFASALNSMSRQTSSIFSSSPDSQGASSGSSGFSGGSSGGGFGGGGGGSW